jgi:hypothetical protein
LRALRAITLASPVAFAKCLANDSKVLWLVTPSFNSGPEPVSWLNPRLRNDPLPLALIATGTAMGVTESFSVEILWTHPIKNVRAFSRLATVTSFDNCA